MVDSSLGKIEVMRRKHISQVARIHADSLANDFLPSLGKKFLRVLYRGISKSKSGIVYVYLEGDEVAGFVVGSTNTGRMFKEILRKKWFDFIVTLIPVVLLKPSVIFKVVESIFYPSKTVADEAKAEIIVIAVAEKHRNKKIAKKLLSELKQYFIKKNVKEYKAVVLDGKDINKIYPKLGYKLSHTFNLYKQKCNVFTYTLENEK